MNNALRPKVSIGPAYLMALEVSQVIPEPSGNWPTQTKAKDSVAAGPSRKRNTVQN